MDLWQLTLIVLRRWYVFLPLCALTALAVTRAGDSVPFEYTAQSKVLLVQPVQFEPTEPDEPILSNPYLSQGLVTTAAAMQAVMASQSVRTQMVAAGGTGDYVVAASTRNPIIELDVTAATAAQASATARTFPTLLAEQLDRAQDRIDAPGNQRVGVEALAVDQSPIAGKAGLRQAQAIVGGLGLGIAVAAALALEALIVVLRRRRVDSAIRRRERASAAAMHDLSFAQDTARTETGRADASGDRRGSSDRRASPPVASLRD